MSNWPGVYIQEYPKEPALFDVLKRQLGEDWGWFVHQFARAPEQYLRDFVYVHASQNPGHIFWKNAACIVTEFEIEQRDRLDRHFASLKQWTDRIESYA